MPPRGLNNRFVLLACGLILGLGISTYWPHEPLKASASGLEKFSLCTSPTLIGQSDAVFVLDSVSGRLVGAVHNSQAGAFNQVWTRNVATDFGVVEDGKYLMVSGFLRTTGATGGTPATGGIYVAELTSGKVALYGYMMNNRNKPSADELIAVAQFPFRDGK